MQPILDLQRQQQLRKVTRAFFSGKYAEMCYNTERELVIFTGRYPLRRNCYACDSNTWLEFLQSLL